MFCRTYNFVKQVYTGNSFIKKKCTPETVLAKKKKKSTQETAVQRFQQRLHDRLRPVYVYTSPNGTGWAEQRLIY